MAPSSVNVNEVLWGAWCHWLAARSLHWSDATIETITHFLNGPAPSQRRRHRPAHNPARMSSLTQLRYFRVLKGVYENAFINGWISEPPTLKTPQPEYIPKDAQGGVLPPGMLTSLQNTGSLQKTSTATSDRFKQWWLLRDRAAVALVAETGITTAELIDLKLKDLGAGGHNILDAMNRAAQSTLYENGDVADRNNTGTPNLCGEQKDMAPMAPVVLTVRPSHTLEGRSFVLPERVCNVLLPWVKLREQLLLQKAEALATAGERASYMRKHGLNGPIFPSRQGRQAEAGEGVTHAHFFPMKNAAVYLIFKRAFAGLHNKKTSSKNEHHLQQGLATAKGPSVIRNTLIQQWLRDLPEEQAQERAGFKTLEGMRVIARAAGITTASAKIEKEKRIDD